MTHDHSRQAAAKGWAARKNQAATLGRAIPASRDDAYVRVTIDTALVRQAARVIDRDPTLVAWIAEQVLDSQAGPGRPGHLSVRSALIFFWLQNVALRNCHLINLPSLLANLSPKVRRHLGVDYLDSNGRPCQLSYGQVLRAFNNMANAFDPFTPNIDELEARARAANLQELSLRLVRASVDGPAHVGDYAVDATLVWSWDRPPGSLNRKLERKGRDGDNGRPEPFSAVVGTDKDGELDLAEAHLVDDPIAEVRKEQLQDEKKPKKKNKRQRHHGAAWVGRGKFKSKSVYGYAMHTATVTDPNAPSVIEALAVTPAPANPARAAVPLLRALFDARRNDSAVAPHIADGTARALGTVVADPGYSMFDQDWMPPIRALGGSAIFRLHRTNQAGRKSRHGATFVDGRPYCDCIPDELSSLAYPKFPYRRETLDKFQSAVVGRNKFEMKPNGGYRANGSRQFLSPHFDTAAQTGGCEHCVDAYGKLVIDPVTHLPKPRCCTQHTRTFPGTDLVLYQAEPFGTPEWERLWNPRNRVEGSYGALKSLATVNWGHDYHHFTGLARETLVATFAVMAYNFHTQRTFASRKRKTEDPPSLDDLLPSAQPTETLPSAITEAKRAAEAERREASAGARRVSRYSAPTATPARRPGLTT